MSGPTGGRLERAKSLFETALGVPREEREALLAESCGEDSELREFVVRLLESHESEDGSFLTPPERSEANVTGEATQDIGALVPGPRVGTRIDPYELTGMLGEGGMGTVWKGWDSLLERSVAIKFLAERLGTSEHAHQRFLREARSASTLSHPGIATVFNAGEHEGRVYIVFRLIDGETVSARAKRGPLPVAEALRLAREAAEALGHAHDRGVLHRDVTSRNVMIDEEDRAVIVDFGLALPEGDTRITRTGSTLGTVGYMAPEIVRGLPADRRSDLYGLGVVLYEMLTASLPFEGERAESVLYAVVNEPVEAPSRRRSDLPRDVDRVLLKLLAKSPDRRYQDAAELVQDLRRLEEGMTPAADVSPAESATQLWTEEEAPRQESRRGGGWRSPRRWLLVAAATAATAAIAYYFWPPSPAPERPEIRIAVLPLQNDSEQAEGSDYMAAGISEALATKLGNISSLRVTPWITSRAYRPMEPLPLADIASEIGVDLLVAGTFRKLGSRLQIRPVLVDGQGMQTWADEFLGLESDLLDISERIAVSLCTDLLKGDLTEEEKGALARKPTDSVEAYRFYLQGSAMLQEGTRTGANLALAFFEKATSVDPDLAEAYVGIGAVYSDRYFYGWEGGYRSLELAEANYRTALMLDPDLRAGQRGLIRVAWEKGNSEECLRIGAEAANTDPLDVGALFTRAEAYLLGGLPDLAVPLLEEIIRLDPANEGAHWFLVIADVWAGRHEETIAAAEEYLRRFLREDPEIFTWLGVSHHSRGELEQARMAYARAIELFGSDTNRYVDFFAGILEAENGRQEEALAIWNRAIALIEPTVSAYPDNARMAATLATLYGLAGDTERASALSTREPDGTPALSEVYLAVPIARSGHPDEAVALLRELVRAGMLSDSDYVLKFLKRFLPGVETAPGWEDFLREHDALEQRLRDEYAPGPATTRRGA